MNGPGPSQANQSALSASGENLTEGTLSLSRSALAFLRVCRTRPSDFHTSAASGVDRELLPVVGRSRPNPAIGQHYRCRPVTIRHAPTVNAAPPHTALDGAS